MSKATIITATKELGFQPKPGKRNDNVRITDDGSKLIVVSSIAAGLFIDTDDGVAVEAAGPNGERLTGSDGVRVAVPLLPGVEWRLSMWLVPPKSMEVPPQQDYIERTYSSGYAAELPSKLVDFIAHFSRLLKEIPKEFRDKAKINFSGYGEDGYVDYEITATEPMTEDDIRQRRDERIRHQQMLEAQERAQYERLKARFDPKADE